MSYVEGPRLYRITETEHGARVLLASYMMVVNTILSVIARGGIKLATARRWSWDDTVISLSMAMSIGHSISMAKAFDHGMGKHLNVVPASSLDGFLRAIYASNVFYIAAIVLAKMSVLLFILRLTPSIHTLQICKGAFVFLTLWGTATVFVGLFSCGAIAPWNYSSSKCINLGAFSRATSVLDIATDVFLVALPVYVFGTMQFQKAGRWTVIGVFSFRAITIIASAIRMASIESTFQKDRTDFTWNCVPFEIWTAVAMHCSIITASVPCVRPFLRSLESGLLDSSMRKHPRLRSVEDGQEKSYALTTLTGWSARIMVDKRRRGSLSNSQKTMRRSILACNGEKAESEHDEPVDEDQEFARQLRPDLTTNWAEHRTNIQSTRTFPSYNHPLQVEIAEGSGSTGQASSWRINMTRETSIRYEEGGRNVQEIRTSGHIGQAL